MKKIRLIILAALVSSSGVAYANDVYIAGSIGQSDFGSMGGGTSSDKNGTAFKLQLGYQVNPNWAVDGGYVDLGKSTYSGPVPGYGMATVQIKATGFNIGAVGTVPLHAKFSLFGKFGMIDGKVEAQVTIPGRSGSASATKWKPTYGFGVKYDVSRSLGIVGEYEHFDKLGDDSTIGFTAKINMLSAGGMDKF